MSIKLCVTNNNGSIFSSLFNAAILGLLCNGCRLRDTPYCVECRLLHDQEDETYFFEFMPQNTTDLRGRIVLDEFMVVCSLNDDSIISFENSRPEGFGFLDEYMALLKKLAPSMRIAYKAYLNQKDTFVDYMNVTNPLHGHSLYPDYIHALKGIFKPRSLLMNSMP
eukprot:TRINITY_DN4966_c0_g1_i6.p1 TRINITY_DN4966_c0_g1~~TRINITY_DN4966_c0_g1_i6.p1  ORF type:complete len:166 (+),score=4.20 TRINITY_DN4966_c0_g1_i6:437-934(+)